MTTEMVIVLVGSLGLLMTGMWIPFVVAVAGIGCIVAAQGVVGLRAVGFVTWGASNAYTLTAIPLYILMAEFLLRSGVASRLYRGLSSVTNKLPGGLLQSNILGCGLFSAISGSSVTTAAALGTVAIPELKARNYPLTLTYGSLAAGGTLGILIPPSIALIIYGTFSDVSIVSLFAAGVIPGLMVMCMFMAYVAGAMYVMRPKGIIADNAPEGARSTMQVLQDIAPTMALILLVLGSLYTGWATPTEAAGLGSALALAVGFIWGDMNWEKVKESFSRSSDLSVVILFIVISAYLLSYGLTVAGIGQQLLNFVQSLELSTFQFLAILILIYVVMGMFVESTAMIVITVPLLVPLLPTFGIDPLWFGIFAVLLIEIGQITPPFGINLFVLQGLYRDPSRVILYGAAPYYLIMLLAIVMIYMFPQIVLWLPKAG